MASVLSDKRFHDEEAAYAWVESKVWPNGPVCPRCNTSDRISKMQGKSTRIGIHKCYACRKPFTIKVGTVFESSHVAMPLWLQAMFLMTSSKKGISSNQIARTLGVTVQTAWFMSHRIRLAMQTVGVEPMGGYGKVVEADETLIVKQDHVPHRVKGYASKNTVLTLVERGGAARSFRIDTHTSAEITPYPPAPTSRP